MKKFLIKGVGEPLDGLIAHVGDHWELASSEIAVAIVRLQSASKLFDAWSLPLADDAVYIKRKHLHDLPKEQPAIPLLEDNPFGGYIGEGSLNHDKIKVVWVAYHSATTVKITESGNTLFSQNFWDSGKRCDVAELLTLVLRDKKYDWDNLVFDLKEISDDDKED